MNHSMLKVREPHYKPSDYKTATGKPKRGFAAVKFLDCREEGQPQVEFYDLRGGVTTPQKFKNWVKREFGYLRYQVEFG